MMLFSNYSNYDTLFDQAQESAKRHLLYARWELDKEFGEGFAKNNPSLVAAMLHAISTDFSSMALSKTARDFTEALKDTVLGT